MMNSSPPKRARKSIERIDRCMTEATESQCFVSCQMSKAVVDALEFVDIDHDQPKPLEMSLEQLVLLFQDRVDVAPIVETGQMVHDRHVGQLFQLVCKSTSGN